MGVTLGRADAGSRTGSTGARGEGALDFLFSFPFFKAGMEDCGETPWIWQGREHTSLAPPSFPVMKPVPALPGHDGKSCRGTASPKFVSWSACAGREKVLCQENLLCMHFYSAMHHLRRPLVTTAHPAVGRKSSCCIRAQAGPSSPGPNTNTCLLSGTPLNPDETALPFQNPTLRQHVACVATARHGQALSTAPSPLETHPGTWHPRPRAVWRAGGKQESWRWADGRQPPLADPASRKMCFCSLGNAAALQEQKTTLAPSFSHPQSWKSDMKFLKQTF